MRKETTKREMSRFSDFLVVPLTKMKVKIGIRGTVWSKGQHENQKMFPFRPFYEFYAS